MSKNELRYLYIGSISITALLLLSGGIFLATWRSDTFGSGSAYQEGLGLLILLGLALTGLMCLLCWAVALSNLRNRAISVRAAVVSMALSAVASAFSLAYPAATVLAFGAFLVSTLVLLVVGLGAALGYLKARRAS